MQLPVFSHHGSYEKEQFLCNSHHEDFTINKIFIYLISEPCLVLALRGVNAFSKLESVIPSQQNRKPGVKGHLDMIHSRSAEQAYSFMRLFFMERELFSDPLSRPLLPYIPHHLHMDDEEG